MNAPDNLAPVAALRARLWAAGFRPVGVVTGDKMPRIANWQERARRNPPADAEEPPRGDHLNTGILCDGLRAIDVDIDDTEAAARIKDMALTMLGETIIRTRSNSPRCALVYRAAEDSPKKRTLTGAAGKIEVLGHGQQLHAFGRHPSGVELQWHPEPPGAVTWASLPAVTENAIEAFLAAAAPIIGADIPSSKDNATTAADIGRDAESEATADSLDVAAALASIPNVDPADWEPWNNVGLAIWAATGGSEAGFHAWDGWSQRNPKYDAQMTRKQWEHYKSSPPNRTGAGKLFAMAARAQPGWMPPSRQAATAPPVPDMTVTRLNHRSPPRLPVEAFGPFWERFVREAGQAAAAPADYVAAVLLAGASALIGNARWAQAWPGWKEPPHLWTCSVGDSGGGKSPGADALLRDVLPEVERRMTTDFPDVHRDWQVANEAHKAALEQWQKDVRAAPKDGKGASPPLPPPDAPPEPQAPRLRQNDVTVEKVATLLATSAPKGLLIVRDELAGWFLGMTQYNDAGRQFWIEAYGGREYRVERVKHPQPIVVRRLAVAVSGGTQPDKLTEMMKGADDGFLARICWFWPERVPFARPMAVPGVEAATEAMDRLRLLELNPGAPPMPADEIDALLAGGPAPQAVPKPVVVPMSEDAARMMEAFAQDMQARQAEAGGLLISALGKARGLALRLSLVLEYLWWCAEPGYAPPPTVISAKACAAAAHLVADYLMPMAERVYGDAATRPKDRNITTLARYILKERVKEVNVRDMHRAVRLPGLGTPETIRAACNGLVDAGWLVAPARTGAAGRPRETYPVRPDVWEAAA